MATETKKIKKGEGIINNFSQRIICQKWASPATSNGPYYVLVNNVWGKTSNPLM
jgi:hypothetical protein